MKVNYKLCSAPQIVLLHFTHCDNNISKCILHSSWNMKFKYEVWSINYEVIDFEVWTINCVVPHIVLNYLYLTVATTFQSSCFIVHNYTAHFKAHTSPFMAHNLYFTLHGLKLYFICHTSHFLDHSSCFIVQTFKSIFQIYYSIHNSKF